MARPDSRQQKDAAARALRAGNHQKALAAYLELAKLHPSDGSWPQRAAEMYRRLGKPAPEMAALARAADLHGKAGFLLKAIAACKMILAVDPQHQATQEKLAAFYAEHGIPRQGAAEDEVAAPAPDPPPESAGEPLEELLLTEAIPAAQPASLAGSEAPGVSEIPLDTTVPPDPTRDEAAVRAVQELLPKVPLFSSLDAASLRRLIDGVRLVSLAEGEELFHQGDPGDALYVIVEGAVVPIAEGEVRKKLAVLDEGDFFGEIALVTNQERNATIEALVDTTLLSLDRSLVASLLQASPRVLKVLLRFLRDRLVHRLFQTSSLFAPPDPGERGRLAERFRFLEVREGVILIRQNELTDALFVLLAGEMDVIQSEIDRDRVLAQLRVGDVFGEMSVLTGAPAIASVAAKRKSWVLALPREDVGALLKGDSRLRKAIAEVAERRRAENAQSLGRGFQVDRQLDLI
jgi:CRP-like cAMP-binding protein